MPEVDVPPLVTVVVPVYGVEAYVEECLRSILAQSYDALQVVVVDDGSTDGSMAIVERLAALDARVEVHRYPNGGLGRARNRGITHATGEYLAFVDSDDVLPPKAIETLVAALEETGSDFATGNVERLTVEGRKRSPQHQPALSRRVLRTTLSAKPDLVYSTTSCNSLFRRSFWNRAGLRFAHDRLYEDMETTAHACVRAASIDVVGSVTYLWRLREDGSSITQSRADERNLADRVVALEASRRWFAVAGTDVLRAFDQKVAVMDLPIYAPAMGEAAVSTRRLLRDECRRAVARLGGRDALDGLPVRARVLHALIRRRAWDALPAAVEFFRAEGRQLPLASLRGGEGTLALPSEWDGTRLPRLGARTLRVHGEEIAIQVTLEAVQWVGDGLELTGRARLRHLPADHVQVAWVAVAGKNRLDLDTDVVPGPEGSEFVTVIRRADLVASSARSWALEVRIEAAGALRVGPVVPGALRGGLAVVEARPGADDARIVAPVVKRGEPLRIDVRKPPFRVERAQVVGRSLELVVRAAGEPVVHAAVLTAPASVDRVPAAVEQLDERRCVVRAEVPSGAWPAGGPRRALWRVLLLDADGRSHQPAVAVDSILRTEDPSLVPVATRQSWLSVRDEPYRVEVSDLRVSDRGLRVVTVGPASIGNELALRTESGEVLATSGPAAEPGTYELPWPTTTTGEAVLVVVHPDGSDPVALADAAASSVPSTSPDGRLEVARRRADELVVRAAPQPR